MRTFCVWLLLSSILTSGYSWRLASTHSNVIPLLTNDVSLRCFYDGRVNSVEMLSTLTRIRLLKEVKGIRNVTWKMFAEVGYPNKSQLILANPNQPDVSISGYFGQPDMTYLSVTWATASDDTVGSYKCEIDGFADKSRENEKKYTEVVNITDHAATVNDYLGIIVQMKKRSEQISQQLQSLDTQHGAQRQTLEKRIMSKAEIAIEDNYFEVRYWPTDSYTLLTDAFGCPDTPFSKFSAGYMNVQTETRDHPKHAFPSLFNHTLCTNCGTRNVLRFNFCTNNRAEPRLIWPKGSYCIQPSGTTCLANFKRGYTRFYLESLVSLLVTQENINVPILPSVSSKYIDFYFCCRNDGDVNTPIMLPNAKPFYLYRFGGTCQTVYNMDVTNVTIQFDTDDTKTDFFSSTYHADGTINNGSLVLCYYTRQNTSTWENIP